MPQHMLINNNVMLTAHTITLRTMGRTRDLQLTSAGHTIYGIDQV